MLTFPRRSLKCQRSWNLSGHGGKRSTPHCGSEGDHSSPVGTEGHNQLESFGFWRRKFCIKNAEILSVGKIAEFAKFAGGKRRKSPDRCLFNRAKRVMNGRGLTGCRSAADAAWQSSDTALPIRASLLTACWLKSCRAFYVCVGFSESLRICLKSSYSRPCDGYRRLPTDRQGSGQCRL